MIVDRLCTTIAHSCVDIWRENEKLFRGMVDGLFGNSSDCDKQLKRLLKALTNRDQWALACKYFIWFDSDFHMSANLAVFDTWGTQFGSLHGRKESHGLFTDCMDFRYEEIEGKYCKIGIKALDTNDGSTNESLDFGDLVHSILLKNRVSLTNGICVPRSCTQRDVNKFTNAVFGSNDYDGNVFKCFERPKSEAIENFLMWVERHELLCFTNHINLRLVFASIIILTVASSIYGIVMRFIGREPRQSLLIFSLPRNLSELFKINKPESSINCIDGIKVLAAVTIIVGHRSYWMANPWPESWLGRAVRMAIEMYDNSVTTFLACSAFLIAQSFLRSLKNS